MRHALAALAAMTALYGSPALATCTQTGFYRDNINMTAATINPVGTVTGTIDATGCNIGIYYDQGTGAIETAEIFGANYFGVLVNGDVNDVAVTIQDSTVHDIGEVPLNGTQHGVGIYFRALGTGSATGSVSGTEVKKHQKGGIVVNGAGSTVTVSGNTVTGEGPVSYIAQNGIQFGYGASGSAMRNVVTGHAYSGANYASSGGIIVVGGDCYGGPLTTGIQIVGNVLSGNDIGAYLSNLNADCAAPSSPTNIKVVNNTITNAAVTNISGGGTIGYQAGVSDVGNNDKIINNKISGVGYAASTAGAYVVPIDADGSFTNKPKVHANK